MNMFCSLLTASGLLLASVETARAQSPYYPPPQTQGEYRTYSSQFGPTMQAPNASACQQQAHVVARPAPFYPVEQAAYYPVRRTTYYAPTAAPLGVPVATPVVNSTPGVVVGRGILGQPKAYVPGQPLRNALRFVTP